jgi:hypothetical protein
MSKKRKVIAARRQREKNAEVTESAPEVVVEPEKKTETEKTQPKRSFRKIKRTKKIKKE